MVPSPGSLRGGGLVDENGLARMAWRRAAESQQIAAVEWKGSLSCALTLRKKGGRYGRQWVALPRVNRQSEQQARPGPRRSAEKEM